MNLLQNKTVLKLTQEKLLQDYVFDSRFAKNVFFSYLTTKDLRSFEDFLCDYLNDEVDVECQRLYDETVAEILGNKKLKDDFDILEKALRKALLSEESKNEESLEEESKNEESLERYERKLQIKNKPDLSYDLEGFFKIDGVLYYITGETAYDLTDAPFEWVVASSVYSFLKNDTSITSFAWEKAFYFLLHPRFHKELQDLLKNGDLMQTQRKQMLYGLHKAFQNKQERPSWSQPTEIYNFDIIFAILQLITGDENKARELAQNCVSTMSFQGVIDYLWFLLDLEKG